MASLTDYAEKKVTEHLLGIAEFAMPAEAWLALHTASPTDTGSGAAEVSTSGTGYGRVSITAAMTVASSTTGTSTNDTLVAFPVATDDWGTITHVSIWDAETGGNMLMWTALPETKEINTSDIAQFSPSQLIVQSA